MRNKTYWGLGVLVLLIIINVSCLIAKPPEKTLPEPATITYEGETLSLANSSETLMIRVGKKECQY